MPHRDFPFLSSRLVGAVVCLAVFTLATSLCAAAQSETILHSFNDAPFGQDPDSMLVADGFGNLYGTTDSGGTYGGGTVYRLSPESTGYGLTTIYNFDADNVGYEPTGVVPDSAGNLYGTLTTSTGGGVFKLSPSSSGVWNIQIISVFADYAGPSGALTFDKMGNLYGVSAYGGIYNQGSVYELSPGVNGQWQLTSLYSFAGVEDGANPNAGLTFDASGILYGTTMYGGSVQSCGPHNTSGCGTVFTLTSNGSGTWTEKILLIFNLDNGGVPQGGLVFDSAGNFYGTTFLGGSSYCNCGTVYRMSPGSNGAWTQTSLYEFAGGPDGGQPNGFLVLDRQGNLYGTSFMGSVFEISPGSGPYWSERTLHHFDSYFTPQTGVILDSAGNVFGTAPESFYYADCFAQSSNCLGTVFELSPSGQQSWNYVNLFSFPTGKDGIYPATSLTPDGNGNYYGVTAFGGDYFCNVQGCGAVFQLSPLAGGGWSENVIYSLPNPFGAFGPGSALVLDGAGNLYGTFPTTYGSKCECGSVYELSRDANGTWQQNVIYDFLGGKDGSDPYGPLTLAANGGFYGTTAGGGGPNDYGTVYEVTPNSNGSWTENVIYTFHGTDGANPMSALVLDSDGNIYGTTIDGGIDTEVCFYGGCGVVFELSKNATGAWSETVLYRFQGANDGDTPSGVVRDANGNLYGTTADAGPTSSYCRTSQERNLQGCGTVFEVSNNGGQWQKTILYSFQPDVVPGDGAGPRAGLMFDASGDLYGTTSGGGDTAGCHCGTVFKLSPRSDGQWSETNVFAFDGLNGADPISSVLLDSSGNIFGTTYEGGSANLGAVFEIPAGSNAVAKLQRTWHISPQRMHRGRPQTIYPPFARGMHVQDGQSMPLNKEMQ
jgi:uncharacterized repeat protein (TIGR03803 family)